MFGDTAEIVDLASGEDSIGNENSVVTLMY
jgi:hypothetical protein